MEFEWDPLKAAENLAKHRVHFEDAARVFLDDRRIEIFDGNEAHGEDRWLTIGLVYPACLAVVYTLRGGNGEIIRIISARKATSHEAREYREANP